MPNSIPTDFEGAGIPIGTDFEPGEEDVVLTVPTDREEPTETCDCCKPCTLEQYSTACIRFSAGSSPFVELNASPWINAKLIEPNKFLTQWNDEFQNAHSLALMLSNVYHDVPRNIYVCYNFLVEVYFVCDADGNLVMKVIKPQDTRTVAICTASAPSRVQIDPLYCVAIKMPYGWGSPEPACDATDDGKCFFYGVGYGPIDTTAYPLFSGVCGLCTSAISLGRDGGCSDLSNNFRAVNCAPPCIQGGYVHTGDLATRTQGPLPPQEILSSDPVVIDDIMDFEIDLPAEWFLVPYCPDLGLSGFTLEAHVEFDTETCEFVEDGDELYSDHGLKCFHILNQATSICPCTCGDSLGCADPDAWPPTGVQFNIAGLVNNPDCATCCRYNPAGVAECFNRDWNPAIVVTAGGTAATSNYISASGRCAAIYRERCGGSATNDPGVTAFLEVEFSIYIDQFNVVQMNLYLFGFIGYVDNHGAVTLACYTTRHYSLATPLASFNCAGPWDLEDAGDFVNDVECDNNWPNIVEVSPAGSGTNDLGPACCPVTVEDNCDDFIPCPVPPCGTGNPDPNDPDFIIVECCEGREERISRSIRIEIISVAGACPCLASSFDITWSNTFQAWIGSEFACNKTVHVAFWCEGGTFHSRLWCSGTQILAFDGDYATASGSCSPICILWSGALSQITTPCCDLSGTVELFFRDLTFQCCRQPCP